MKLLMIGVCLLLASCTTINHKLGLEDDNAIEQLVEYIIRAESGLNIDLTPGDDAGSR